MYKILVADPISDSGLTVFQNQNGHFKIDARSKLSLEDLKQAVTDVDAIIVRSETKITAEVLAACKKHGVAAGIHLTEFDQAKEWLGKGMRFFTFQNDIRMLMDAGKADTTQLREFIGKKG